VNSDEQMATLANWCIIFVCIHIQHHIS